MKMVKVGLVLVVLLFAGMANAVPVPVTLTGAEGTVVSDFSGAACRDTNFSGEGYVVLGTRGGNYYRHGRAFLQFDISSVQAMFGASTQVVSATLRLNMQHEGALGYDGDCTYGVYRMLDDWEPLETTWNNRLTDPNVPWVGQQSCPWIGGPWNTGDEVALMPTDETVITMGTDRWYTAYEEWDVTADLNAWLSGAAVNNGWFLRDQAWDWADEGEDPIDWTPLTAWSSLYAGKADAQLVLEVIPEPATLVLLGLGGLSLLNRRKK